MKEIFNLKIQQQTEILSKYEKRFSVFGYVKLALFLIFAVCICFMISYWDLLLYKIEVMVLLIIQIIAWVYHSHLRDIIAHASGIIDINRRHLDRIQGKWTAFSDTGEEFFDLEHPYCRDLDIVGSKSLFQYINSAHTWYGRKAFANDLLYSKYQSYEIMCRQEAIKELEQSHELSDELEYHFSCIGNDVGAPMLVEKLQDSKVFMKSKVLRIILTYMSLVSLIFTGVTFLFGIKQLYFTVLILFTLQAVIWLCGYYAVNKYLKELQNLPYKMQAYTDVLKLINSTVFTSDGLRKIQESLSLSNSSAMQAMRELSKITDRMSVRSNGVIYFLVNVFLLWDFKCAFLFEDWKRKYAPHCEKWFLALGELESLSCFATFGKVCDHMCFPRISEGRGVTAEEIGHPLIPNETRVTNTLNLQNNIIIISGSNMSGKTTYIRTVGINLVLARAGSAVCAEEMEFSDLHVITSMRIEDNLSEGVSTFYAELKRIKSILDTAESDTDTLFLIDEIFRGTNSVDRLSGAQAVIRKLSRIGVSGMITTHDLELCSLAQFDNRIQNYSFSEYYERGQIFFDYKIRRGKSQTTNAKHLMEILGIF